MKKLFYFFLFISIFTCVKVSSSQTPTYELTVKNIDFTEGCGYWNSIDFDIYIMNTGSTPLEYDAGQYFIAFNPAIANGGNLTYEIIDSDLPANLRPRNPSIGTAQNPPATLLRLASNPIPLPGAGYIISASFPGTKICRMRLKTSSIEFTENLQPDFTWRNPPAIPTTKISANVNGAITDITTGNTHVINTDGPFICSGQQIPWCSCRFSHAILINSIIEGLYNPATNKLNRKDTVTIELRYLNDPNTVFTSQKLILDSANYSSYFVFSIIPISLPEFYIVVKHFNSIETWSKFTAGYYNTLVNYYDFTDAATKAYGDNLKPVGNNKFGIYSGDVNQDKAIDITDLAIIDNGILNYATGTFLPADLNGDSYVDITDSQIAENNAVNFVTAKTPLN
jgi:Dockerin type I domain